MMDARREDYGRSQAERDLEWEHNQVYEFAQKLQDLTAHDADEYKVRVLVVMYGAWSIAACRHVQRWRWAHAFWNLECGWVALHALVTCLAFMKCQRDQGTSTIHSAVSCACHNPSTMPACEAYEFLSRHTPRSCAALSHRSDRSAHLPRRNCGGCAASARS